MPPNDPFRAALWMTGSITAFTAMAIAGRAVGHVHDSFEVMTVRSLVGFLILLAVGGATGRLATLSTRRLGGHFLRNIVHFTGQNLWFWALTMIPLAQLFALEFTSPIWVIVLAPLFLGERLRRANVLAAALGFAGILIAAHPDLSDLNPGVLAAAGSAIFFAMTTILTKAMTRGDTVFSILFWLTLMQFCFGLIGAGYDGAVTLPTAQTLPWLGLIGACGVLAHLSLTMALSLAPASTVVPMDFVRLPLIAVIGAVAYGEPLDPLVLLGGGVIFLAIWINIRAQFGQRGNKGNITNS